MIPFPATCSMDLGMRQHNAFLSWKLSEHAPSVLAPSCFCPWYPQVPRHEPTVISLQVFLRGQLRVLTQRWGPECEEGNSVQKGAGHATPPTRICLSLRVHTSAPCPPPTCQPALGRRLSPGGLTPARVCRLKGNLGLKRNIVLRYDLTSDLGYQHLLQQE